MQKRKAYTDSHGNYITPCLGCMACVGGIIEDTDDPMYGQECPNFEYYTEE